MQHVDSARELPEPFEEAGVRYEVYEREGQLAEMKEMMDKDLSEPYSVYTYRYFVNACPDLCWLARDADTGAAVGAIVCRLDEHQKGVRSWRGYIAMLAVAKSHRKRRIGTRLVETAVAQMERLRCEEVVLETEISNLGSLALYENLGFLRDKRMRRYYLNGQDAFRLKMPLRPFATLQGT